MVAPLPCHFLRWFADKGSKWCKKAPDELDDVEGNFSTAIAALFAIGEGDGSIFDRQNSGIGDGHPEDIGCQVFQGCLAASYGLTVDAPGDLPACRVDFVEQSLPCHLGLEFCLEYLGEGFDGQVEGVAGWPPFFSVVGQTTGGDDEVQMRVILHLPSPSVEYGGKPRQLGADEARVFGQFFDSAGGSIEHAAIGRLLVGAAEGPNLFGHGKGEHEVVAG